MRCVRLALLFAPALLSSCSLFSQKVDGDVELAYVVRSENDEAQFFGIVEVDPNSNPDLADRRDDIRAATVLKIALLIGAVGPSNDADMLRGQVDVRRKGSGDEGWIMAVGKFDGVPLYFFDANGERGAPATPIAVTLDLNTATTAALSDLVFRQDTDRVEVRIQGVGTDLAGRPKGPVDVSGTVRVSVRAVVEL